IRWFGLVVGYVLVNVGEPAPQRRAVLNALLSIGAAYTLLDTWFRLQGRGFLGRHPPVISSLEALFIGLLCFFDAGLESPFRYFYFLSLICCAIRHPSHVTYATCAVHCASYGALYLALPPGGQHLAPFALTVVMLGWVTWAASAMALLLKR